MHQLSGTSVLFVCLGNICRSPLAEAAFRNAAEYHGLEVHIDSAGTAAYHVGKAPDPRSIRTAAARGIDITHYRGRQIEAEDFHRFTHIFVMDHQNLRNVEAIRPADASAQVALLMDLLPHRAGSAVADPYYGGEDGFEMTWSEVTEAAQALAAELARR